MAVTVGAALVAAYLRGARRRLLAALDDGSPGGQSLTSEEVIGILTGPSIAGLVARLNVARRERRLARQAKG